jgi:formate dehydrogenase major subunit
MPGLLDRWPLLRQIRDRADGTGPEAMSDRTHAIGARIDGAEVARSICPYCGVGCGQLVYYMDGRLLAIEGDPESPISQGTLCPKGSASYELLTHPGRLTNVLHRAPHAAEWTTMGLDEAMDRIAELVWETRKRTFVRTAADLEAHSEPGLKAGSGDRDAPTASIDPDEPVNHTTAIAHLGGATLDNEENYLIKKLFTGGLGMVAVSNQARI